MAIHSIVFELIFPDPRPRPQQCGCSTGVTPPTGFLRTCLLFLLVGVLCAGCATLPQDYPRESSTALEDYRDTSLGRLFEETAAQHPGESGFSIIRHGRKAFTARVALTELAEKSLDLQYYIWEQDETGRILAERLVRAADRGVRVRVLVDDINLSGRDAQIAALDAHPNIEIRLFNPFAHRAAHLFDFVIDMNRVNHRMHNKIMVADNAVAIVGGAEHRQPLLRGRYGCQFPRSRHCCGRPCGAGYLWCV